MFCIKWETACSLMVKSQNSHFFSNLDLLEALHWAQKFHMQYLDSHNGTKCYPQGMTLIWPWLGTVGILKTASRNLHLQKPTFCFSDNTTPNKNQFFFKNLSKDYLKWYRFWKKKILGYKKHSYWWKSSSIISEVALGTCVDM